MMKKLRFTVLVIMLALPCLAQTFTEITEYGWGIGACGSKAVFADLDNNGLLDMILANSFSYLERYEQTGAGSSEFNLISDKLIDLNVGYYVSLCLTDLNHNFLIDLILGTGNGLLKYYEQSEANSSSFILISDTLGGIDVGSSSAPFFIDLDNDGLLDLIIGEYDGNLYHYEQTSANSTDFTLLTENFNEVNVQYYSVPSFADINNDGLLDMIVGKLSGAISHYIQNSENSTGFTLQSSEFNGIGLGIYSAPCFTDLDNDGLLDMIVGEYDGNLNHYEQNAADSFTFSLISDQFYTPAGIDVGSQAAPCFIDLDSDNLLDMLVGAMDGHLHHYKQDEEGSNKFVLLTKNFCEIKVEESSTPSCIDLDGDGLLDLLVGIWDGTLDHYEQNTIGSLEFSLITTAFNGIDVGRYSAPSFTDLENNGLIDLVIGSYDSSLFHYEQNAVGSYEFNLITKNFSGIEAGYQSSPCFIDIDNDQLLDLIIGKQSGSLNHYRQNSNHSKDFTLISENFGDSNVWGDFKPVFVDINRDGLEDLVIGEDKGGIYYFQRDNNTVIDHDMQSIVKKDQFKLEGNYPNPFNPFTTISYHLKKSAFVTLKIYNIKGREIETLVENFQTAGDYKLTWHPKGLSSGIYFCRMQGGDFFNSERNFSETLKLILQK